MVVTVKRIEYTELTYISTDLKYFDVSFHFERICGSGVFYSIVVGSRDCFLGTWGFFRALDNEEKAV